MLWARLPHEGRTRVNANARSLEIAVSWITVHDKRAISGRSEFIPEYYLGSEAGAVMDRALEALIPDGAIELGGACFARNRNGEIETI